MKIPRIRESQRDADTDPLVSRGQVGIGTLIVFIALVLVAAIAAGVLISTAGFLQETGEETGQESTDQVVEGLQVFTATGEGDASNGEIDNASLRVGLEAGASAINLKNVEIQAIGPEETAILEYTDDAEPEGFIVEDGDETLRGDDRATIEIPFDEINIGGENGLDEGDNVELRLTTGPGAQTFVEFTVPDPLLSDAVTLSL